MPESTYLGDGLYASFDGYQIRLMASDGVNIHDQVYLEPSVWNALKAYVQRLEDAAKGT
jgi:hypothetical protein